MPGDGGWRIVPPKRALGKEFVIREIADHDGRKRLLGLNLLVSRGWKLKDVAVSWTWRGLWEGPKIRFLLTSMAWRPAAAGAGGSASFVEGFLLSMDGDA